MPVDGQTVNLLNTGLCSRRLPLYRLLFGGCVVQVHDKDCPVTIRGGDPEFAGSALARPEGDRVEWIGPLRRILNVTGRVPDDQSAIFSR
jgi:hypothetical protein